MTTKCSFFTNGLCGVYPDVEDKLHKVHRLNIEWPDDNPIVQERQVDDCLRFAREKTSTISVMN